MLEEFGCLNEMKEEGENVKVHATKSKKDRSKIGGKKKSKLEQLTIMKIRHLDPIYLIRASDAIFLK